MLLLMLEAGMPIDCVLTADTGMEFPEMYRHWDKIDQVLYQERGIHLTILRHSKGFEWLMFDQPKEKPKTLENRAKLGVPPYGNGWPGIRVRWCTGQLKTHLIAKEVNRLKKEKNALHYVGIAADETERLIKERKPYKLFPLADWGMTESDCLTYCRDSGVNWQEQGIDLYDILDRVSCWCCANKNQWELYNIWRCLPTYWKRLKELQSKTDRPFKKEYSVFDLEIRFENGFVPKRRKKAV